MVSFTYISTGYNLYALVHQPQFPQFQGVNQRTSLYACIFVLYFCYFTFFMSRNTEAVKDFIFNIIVQNVHMYVNYYLEK